MRPACVEDAGDGAGRRVGGDDLLPDGVAAYTASSAPPDEACLDWPAERFAEEVVPGTPNNFLQISEEGGQRVALFGVEDFTATATVSTDSRRLPDAVLDDPLTLHALVGCDNDRTNCAYDGPLTSHRAVTATLLNDDTL